MLFPFRKILWVKSVTLDEEHLAYSGQDPTALAKEPKRPGDPFELHIAEYDAGTLDDPAIGDILALTQHDQLTHLVEVAGAAVQARPKSTIRRGTKDAKFCFQRTCKLLLLRDFDDAPFIEDAFGFEPNAKGGEVFQIEALDAYEASDQPLWMVQRRIHHSMSAKPQAQRLFQMGAWRR